MIDFDDIDKWEPILSKVLNPLVSAEIRTTIVNTHPEYVEDALDLLFRLTARELIIARTLAWLKFETIVGYHGTRLTKSEIKRVRNSGLVPLRAVERRKRIIRALCKHPKWTENSDKLDKTIQKIGPGCLNGKREGQVHLTLSCASLCFNFNHYLKYGSEFDQNVASSLLGPEGVELLSCYGKSTVIQVAVPGELALNAANRYFSVEESISRGNVPNIIHEILKAWSFKLAHPKYQSKTMGVDCGMIFLTSVPQSWIMRFYPPSF